MTSHEARLYKIGLRYYDPQTARWTQKDPITGFADPRRTNRYIYAGQDPINNTDPSGALFGVDLKDAFSAATTVTTAVETFAFTGALLFATVSCFAVSAGSLAPACAFIGAAAATTLAGGAYVTYKSVTAP